MRLAGWDLLLVQPPGPKLVAVAAPHTSNADFWPGIFWSWATRTPVQWVAKAELFANPLVGAVLKSWGGVPVQRSKVGGNFVNAVVEKINQADEIMLNVAPEGTRKYHDHWKSGFYYMALGAGVPIAIVVMDWGKKEFGVIDYLQPTGDIEADFAKIRELMQGVRAHTQANAAPIVPRHTARGNEAYGNED